MTFFGFVAVGSGAAIGAWLRWWLGILLNPLFVNLPLGTLAANMLGGFVMGIAMELLAHYETLAPELRLLITTGFLGGLTTFSTFSAETTTLLMREQFGWAGIVILAHLQGSLLMTLAGISIIRLMFTWAAIS